MSKILIVENDQDSRDLLRILLEGRGHEVAEAVTGEQGFAEAMRFRPDLVLMDISLPGAIDGLEATRRLRSDGAFDCVPILALTAHALRGDRERMLLAGCDEHVTKPLDDLVAFVTLVDRYLADGRTPRP
jgi:CheY-like chemotaxis protein